MNLLNPNSYELPENLEVYFDKIYALFIERFSLPNYDIELSVVDEETIKELNAKYRNKDSVTDVLSFPLAPEKQETLLGAIYFCFAEIKKNNEDLIYEFCFLFVHSFLHLLGYEHGDEMFSLQDQIIKQVF